MLAQTISADMKAAMKSGDTLTRDTLRMLESSIKNEEISGGSRDAGLDDAGVMTLVKRAIKQRTDSATQYRDGGREELAHKEEDEISVLEKYLPEQMSTEEVEAIVANVIAEVGATSVADLGKVMGGAMQAVGDRADGNAVRDAANKILQK